MDQAISFDPVGCDQCGATALNAVGDGKFQCAYCGAFSLVHEPPPLEPPRTHDDPAQPPPSQVAKVSAIEVLQLGTQGEVAAPSAEQVLSILDRRGPRGILVATPLSRFVKIADAAGYAPLRISYATFREQRSYEEVTHPDTGASPATGPLPPLWSEPLRPEQQVTVRRVPVRARERVGTCPRCVGQGWLTCVPCRGDGRDSCMWCGGRGHTTRTQQKGNSTYEVSETCTWCSGSGWVTCTHCQGRGRNTCDVCAGRTRVLFTWERVEDFGAPTAMEAISHGRDWSGMSWMHRAEGELLFDRTVQGMMQLTEADGPIAQLAEQVVRQHNHGLAECYVYWSRLTVTRVPVVEVRYRVRTTPGVLHIYGRNQQVSMPGKKPVGCMGIMLWVAGALGALGAAATLLAGW